MITAEQIRAARHALNLTFAELAEVSGVSMRTLKTIENESGIPNCRTSTLKKIQQTLEAVGIEFIGSPEDGPGIRIRSGPRGASASDARESP